MRGRNADYGKKKSAHHLKGRTAVGRKKRKREGECVIITEVLSGRAREKGGETSRDLELGLPLKHRKRKKEKEPISDPWIVGPSCRKLIGEKKKTWENRGISQGEGRGSWPLKKSHLDRLTIGKEKD